MKLAKALSSSFYRACSARDQCMSAGRTLRRPGNSSHFFVKRTELDQIGQRPVALLKTCEFDTQRAIDRDSVADHRVGSASRLAGARFHITVAFVNAATRRIRLSMMPAVLFRPRNSRWIAPAYRALQKMRCGPSLRYPRWCRLQQRCQRAECRALVGKTRQSGAAVPSCQNHRSFDSISV